MRPSEPVQRLACCIPSSRKEPRGLTAYSIRDASLGLVVFANCPTKGAEFQFTARTLLSRRLSNLRAQVHHLPSHGSPSSFRLTLVGSSCILQEYCVSQTQAICRISRRSPSVLSMRTACPPRSATRSLRTRLTVRHHSSLTVGQPLILCDD